MAVLVFVMIAGAGVCEESAQQANDRVSGYQGIWFTLGQQGEYGDKYSGGLGTYTAKHKPLAVYSEAAKKTFFVYGGAKMAQRHLLIMAGYYDHETGMVPRPTIVHDKEGVDDPHDNASIALAPDGHLWVFISGRGRSRPGFKYRSVAPHSIDAWEQITEEEITYPQPWWVPGEGFIHLFTKYTKGRELYWNTSPDGYDWTADQKLAGMGGHYQNSRYEKDRVFSAFNMHPGGNVDKRTNLYYVESYDMGGSWQTAAGDALEMPLTDKHCAALVRDFEAEGLLVYMKDVALDAAGNPAILFITSRNHMPGPEGDPRTWRIAHWQEESWAFREVTTSTHNYDMGSLYIEGDLWRIIGPTEAGPQTLGCGGEMVLWESRNAGQDWERVRQLTRDSLRNHTYARRPLDAQDDFYAFWADGNPDEMSMSQLYFCNRDGDVWRLPYLMTEALEKPQRVFVD
jgi:hypothetical protein